MNWGVLSTTLSPDGDALPPVAELVRFLRKALCAVPVKWTCGTEAAIRPNKLPLFFLMKVTFEQESHPDVAALNALQNQLFKSV
jgi:hypothetical protein